MLRKTLGTVTAISAICVGSAAMAAHMGGGGGGWGGGGGMMHGGRAPMMNGGGSMGPTMRAGPMTGAPMTGAPMTRSPTTTGPVMGGRVQGWNGRTAWGGRFHDHFHNRHSRFFAFGLGGPIYDYAYDSCWTQVRTYYGFQWVNVCGDYSGWGY